MLNVKEALEYLKKYPGIHLDEMRLFREVLEDDLVGTMLCNLVYLYNEKKVVRAENKELKRRLERVEKTLKILLSDGIPISRNELNARRFFNESA